ncbi:MAG: hypothetical protein QNJ46_14145 [Leptolyngbyaceae cyanobacterium MO_188.B28]|nr:hypothetical protein [Leptolyngbyaceae cyanobacterium MO_188.B28]
MTLEQVLLLANQLSVEDQLRLIERIAPQIQKSLATIHPKASRSLWGLCSDLGPAPSAEVIDQVRGEVWADFGQENIV